MDTILIYPIALPILVAIVCLFLPPRFTRAREGLALITAVVETAITGFLFGQPDERFSATWLTLAPNSSLPFDLRSGVYARFIMLAIALFSLLAVLYSIKFVQDHPRHREYYACVLAASAMGIGVALANHLLVLLFFWELLGILLFLAVMVSGQEAVPSGTKTLVISGVGDLSLLMGMTLLWLTAGTANLSDLAARPLVLEGWVPIAAFLLLLVGATAKSGVVPLHSWIPAISTVALAPVMSFFTALDKLIGIYLLARLTLNWFVMTPGAGLLLMTLGAISLLAGVLMAMVQHDFRRMLAFHSVSQVGYMVLGIGTGSPLGIIGGLFHMLNMIIVKGNLFLCGGSVQRQTGRTEFAELGGLARAMPWTFACTLVASLSIAGVPPLNAFVSKWLIYQGILDQGGTLFPLFLVIAMFGSALTLASFMKLLYSMFWGGRPTDLQGVKESSSWMLIPMVVLTLVSIAFGIGYGWPVDTLLVPLLGAASIHIPGLWESGLAAGLLIISLIVGALIYWLGHPRGVQDTDVFLGGERMDSDLFRVTGTQFYGPIKEMGALKRLYPLAEQGVFDIYNYGARVWHWIGRSVYDYVEETLTELYQEVLPDLVLVVGQILRRLDSRRIITYVAWGVYIVSLLWYVAAPENRVMSETVQWVAGVGMVGWAVLALVEVDLRRLVVLAATSQMGIVVLGFTLSPTLAVAYLVTTGLALILLLLCTQSFVHICNTGLVAQMKGVAVRAPGWFYVFLFAAFWLAGLPPFGNFWVKYQLGAMAEGISPWVSVVITATAILTLAYMLRPIRSFLIAAGKDVGSAAPTH